MKRLQIFVFFAAFAVIIAAVFAACAKPPTEEMNNASEAVTRAENDIDAVTYGAGSLARAKDALARMQAEADSKRYDSAKSYAAEAVAAAQRAIDEGRTGATRAQNEAASLVSELQSDVTETEQGINAARSAGLALNFKSIDKDFEEACENVENAQTALSDGRYQEALEKGKSARTDLTEINRQLSGAAMSVSRKK